MMLVIILAAEEVQREKEKGFYLETGWMPRGLEDKFKLLSQAENVLEKLIYFPLMALHLQGEKGGSTVSRLSL